MTSALPEPLADLGQEIEAAAREAFRDSTLRLTIAEPAPGGHSGFTYLLRFEGAQADQRAVVRVPPPSARPVGPADVLRQGRIMAALGAAGLPAPAILAMVPGEQTISGRPFLLMEHVVADPAAVTLRTASATALLASALATLDGIERLPVEATGLDGEPVRPSTGQVDRWEPLMKRGPAELTRGSDQLAEKLRRRAPADGRAGLVHGDYQFGNLLFIEGRVAAVLDWEIAELGPPEVDRACLVVAAVRRRFPLGPAADGNLDIDLEEVLQAAAAGHPDLGWYVSAGCYKYAAILAYNLDLHLRGKRIDPIYEGMRGAITDLVAIGRETLGGGPVRYLDPARA
jgi:aminoglycoside phosphotransferase (APT) family kinase protein